MFSKKNTEGYAEITDGIKMKPLVHGSNSLLTEIVFEKDSFIDTHSHPHEQIGYLISGSFKLTIGDEEYQVKPGDSWCIEGGTEHSAKVCEDSVAVEVFTPVREEYLNL